MSEPTSPLVGQDLISVATAPVMDGPRSLIWGQAENRLHARTGLLVESPGRTLAR
jgi:ornithine carbamoyltransferase